MRALLAIGLLLLATTPGKSSQLFLASIQGASVYCSGVATSSCSAYGTAVPDFNNAGNWSLLTRVRFDPAVEGGTHWIVNAVNVSGAQYQCAQMLFIANKQPGPTMPVSIRFPLVGGLGDTTVLTSTKTDFYDGLWHTLVITHDSAHNWKLYVDGPLDVSANLSVPTDTGCNVQIATADTNGGCGKTGLLDVGCWINDVAFFPAVLPANDVLALASGARPNLISVNPSWWYPMDGAEAFICPSAGPGAGNIDASGNGKTLRLGTQPHGDYCTFSDQTNAAVMPPSGEATH